MAKFGIALGSGPRGLGFESRHSDQKSQYSNRHTDFFLLVSAGIRKAVKKTVQRTVFRPWENPLIDKRIQYGCG